MSIPRVLLWIYVGNRGYELAWIYLLRVRSSTYPINIKSALAHKTSQLALLNPFANVSLVFKVVKHHIPRETISALDIHRLMSKKLNYAARAYYTHCQCTIESIEINFRRKFRDARGNQTHIPSGAVITSAVDCGGQEPCEYDLFACEWFLHIMRSLPITALRKMNI